MNATGFYPWLLPLRGILYDALHLFVHPHDGYRLSDRVWRADDRTRANINRLLQTEIRIGTSAVDIAKSLEEYLQPEREGVKTAKPYGRWGSYDARRLARTEITAAAGRGVIGSSKQNPLVGGIRWVLSPDRERDWPCRCAANSRGGDGGVYAVDEVPDYPDHPHCMCTLRPEPAASPEEVVQDLREWLKESPAEQDLSSFAGMFDLTGMLWDLLVLYGMRR